MAEKVKKQSYKDIHGETRIGAYLRSINKSELVAKAISVAGKAAGGNFLGAISEILSTAPDLTPEQMNHAIKLLEMDMTEMQEITKRWQSDNESDAWLPKNIRPLTLLALVISTIILLFLDGSTAFVLTPAMVTLLSTIDSIVFLAYFGGRSIEKGIKTWKR